MKIDIYQDASHKQGIAQKMCCILFALVTLEPFAAPISHTGALPELIQGAMAFHPTIRSQQALVESANAGMDAARWQFYPTPSVSVERANAPSDDPTYRFGDKQQTIFRLQQTLWSGGRLTAGLRKAEAGILSSEASVEAAKQELALRVVQYYADWYSAYFKILSYEKSLAVHRHLRQQTVRRIAEGASPASDLTLVDGRTEQTVADLSVSQAQQETALGHLAQLLGKPVTQNMLVDTLSAPLDEPEKLSTMLELAQASSPNVARLMANARIQETEITERKADMLPEIYLRAERQYGNYTYANAPNENRFFVGVTTHFGAGLSSMSVLSGARARYESALADVATAKIGLSEQILSDYAMAASGKGRLVSLAAALDSSETIAEAWGRQFLAGRKSWLDVMNAARELAQVEAQIADVKSGQLLMTWRLSLLVHGVDAVLVRNESKLRKEK